MLAWRFVLGALLLLLSGCQSTAFDHPLGSPEQGIVVPSLEGHWTLLEQGKATEQVTIRRLPDHPLYALYSQEQPQPLIHFYIVDFKGHHFWHMLPDTPLNQPYPPFYLLLLGKQVGTKLTLSLLNPERISNDLQSGLLAGSYPSPCQPQQPCKRHKEHLAIKTTTAKLQSYFAHVGSAPFNLKVVTLTKKRVTP
ncbi:hypothetical protein [Magnetococcus sp. PR-3]|uniref:hypothetical protein n=1 Tax=Magnetococcus sp. PR-3 TaxID=3120355 RepID=UPI002FCDFE3C